MTWVDVVDESTRNLTRPTRPTYIPPHLRHSYNNGISNDNYTLTPTFPRSNNGFNSPELASSSWTRGGGRGGGRNSPWGGPSPSPNPNRHGIRDKFEGLNVTENDDNTDNVKVDGTAINFDAYEDVPVEASGSNVPRPVTSFLEIDLGEALNQNIKRCKYMKPTPVQRHAIPIGIAGRDLMACAQTGSGKTAAFCFPIICGIIRERSKQVASGRGGVRVAYPTALILSPTRELSCQIYEEATKFAYRTGVKIVVAYGGAPIGPQFRNLENGVDILVATPGRLVDMIERARVSLKKIKYLTLDEADRMLDMGFEQQIRKIVQQMDMPAPGERQTLLFSATFPEEIQRLASDFLSDYIFLTVGKVGSSTDLITQRVELVQDMDKRSHLLNLLRSHKAIATNGKPALTLVFVETKRGADALEHWLSMNGFPAISIHGDKVQRERERALRSFKSGATPILVATDVASRGLDIPRVAHVINFDFPRDIDDYVHRIGRTGRAGNSGLATAFFSDKNLQLAKPLVELMHEAKQEVPSWLTQYAEDSPLGVSGRSSRYKRSNFGGSDYRRSSQSWSEDYYNSRANGDMDSNAVGYATSGDYCGAVSAGTNAVFPNASADGGYYGAGTYAVFSNASADGGYHAAANVDSYADADVDSTAAGSHEYGYSHGFVATGWD